MDTSPFKPKIAIINLTKITGNFGVNNLILFDMSLDPGIKSSMMRYGVACLLFIYILCGCADVQTPDPAVRYIAFGDSSTRGPSQRNYPDILRELLKEEPQTFANEGQGGETPGRGLERFRGLLDMGLYPNAHTLFYWQGAGGLVDYITEVDQLLLLSPNDPDYPHTQQLNDKLNNIQNKIESVISSAKSSGLTVYVATYFSTPEIIAPCEPLLLNTILPVQARHANHYIDLLNERIRAAVDNQSAILVDVASRNDTLLADPENYYDCAHLSEKGNQIVAQLFFEIITSHNDTN